MFKMAFNLLLSKKKWFAFIVSSLSLILAGTISIIFSTEMIKSGLKEAACLNYGSHSGVLMSLEEYEGQNRQRGRRNWRIFNCRYFTIARQ